jgi:hypothetical protein
MKRQIPGLHRESRNGDETLEGVFLVPVDRAFYRWHPQPPFYALRFVILEPKEHQGQSLNGGLYRYRYLDGWREKENRASLLFGRAFEKALATYFAGEDRHG